MLKLREINLVREHATSSTYVKNTAPPTNVPVIIPPATPQGNHTTPPALLRGARGKHCHSAYADRMPLPHGMFSPPSRPKPPGCPNGMPVGVPAGSLLGASVGFCPAPLLESPPFGPAQYLAARGRSCPTFCGPLYHHVSHPTSGPPQRHKNNLQ